MFENVTTNIATMGGNFGPAASSVSKNEAQEQKDQFLKLLTFQLRAQNPLKPYDNQEFATQLAQFSQLEQLSDIKGLLEEQSEVNMTLSRVMSNSALPGMLGKYAKAYTTSVNYDGDQSVSLGFDMDMDATEAKATIYDDKGRIVRTINLSGSNLRVGEHTIQWDGKDDNGNTLDEGNYSFFVDFKNARGSEQQASTFTYGKIEAVRFKNNGTVLIVDGLEIPIGDVTDIRSES
jgi:flagellar basal-body rod modification protein FlgD